MVKMGGQVVVGLHVKQVFGGLATVLAPSAPSHGDTNGRVDEVVAWNEVIHGAELMRLLRVPNGIVEKETAGDLRPNKTREEPC